MLAKLLISTAPPCEGNRPSASQEISGVLSNLSVHRRIHNTPQRVPLLRQTDPIHAPIPFP